MMELNLSLTLDENNDKEKKKQARIKEAERKKALKEYQPTDQEVWFTGYETHTGKHKAGIFQMKISDADRKKLEQVYEAIQLGELSKGVDDMKKFSKTHALNLYQVLIQKRRTLILEKMVRETPDKYILVMDEQGLHEMFNALKDEPIIAVDTETTGLNLYGRDKIVGVSFTAPTKDLHFYIPIRHDEGNAPFEKAWYWIERVLKIDMAKIFHNATFDLHQFKSEGYEVNGDIHDTQELMKVLNENEPSYRLKDLVPKYLKIEGDTFDQLFGKTPFNEVALKYARYYACKDTHITWLLFDFLMEHLKKQKGLYNYYMEVEQPLIRVVFEMEREGFIIDMDEVERQKEILRPALEETRKELVKVLGDINFNSPAQLLPALQRTVDKNLQGTGKKELKPHKHHPVIKLLQKYKDDTKQLTGFVETIDTFIQPDGKLHGSFKQNGARTGRFSSSEPNLQQQPYEARKMFRVHEDYLILGLDFSAQEPRMLTHYTQEPILIENYRNGRDLYATLGSEFYGLPYEQCYKNPDGSDTKIRKEFKVVVLAIMYGMGAGSLGGALGITTRKAQEMIDTFYAKFPKVAEFVRNNTIEACKQGYVEMKLGDLVRKRRLPFFKGRNPERVYDTYSTNAKIQGTSAIQTKKCMIEGSKLCKRLSKTGRTFGLLACVHDELLFRVPKDVTREEVAMFEKIMTETVKLNGIPSGTDGELGNCWGTLTPIKQWFANK
ncbi:DNA polymerase [Bacillus cereus group sp. Bc015]|uniref:DNA polymerase n=1 Tax=Bacillus cereus group sp. Bc015 TaxID=3018123 RepID=UPI0022E3444A|nr:DNA polymerase [Bacillus cereus group sp. Bc015]MDA2738435.1 DNA polymerase [Bacillus cereus group sp. Bc015]